MTGSKNLSQIDTAFLHICWGNFVNGVRATVRRNAGVWFSVLLISLLPSPEVSASSKLTYHGRILGPEETPIEGKVDFKVQVLDSGKTCLLYQETHTIDEVKNGIFALTIGADEATKEAGLAASVEEVLPELVHTDPNTGLKSVQYANLVAVLVAAVQEQQLQIAKERQVNLEQERQIQDLETRLRALEERLK